MRTDRYGTCSNLFHCAFWKQCSEMLSESASIAHVPKICSKKMNQCQELIARDLTRPWPRPGEFKKPIRFALDVVRDMVSSVGLGVLSRMHISTMTLFTSHIQWFNDPCFIFPNEIFITQFMYVCSYEARGHAIAETSLGNETKSQRSFPKNVVQPGASAVSWPLMAINGNYVP